MFHAEDAGGAVRSSRAVLPYMLDNEIASGPEFPKNAIAADGNRRTASRRHSERPTNEQQAHSIKLEIRLLKILFIFFVVIFFAVL